MQLFLAWYSEFSVYLPRQYHRKHYSYSQIEAFDLLTAKADELKKHSSEQPDVLIWRGIIYASYAGIKGGLSALSMAKTAKADLEKAIEIDEQALNGSAYTTLGTLYFYALFLMDEKHYKQAESYLLFAKKAAPRADRPLADKGRLMEIDRALAEVNKHMNDQTNANTAN